METVLDVVQVLISVILIFLVLLHSGKDAGLSGAFGIGQSGSAFGGGSLVERNLDRWTIFFSILFVLNTLVLLARAQGATPGFRPTSRSCPRRSPSRAQRTKPRRSPYSS